MAPSSQTLRSLRATLQHQPVPLGSKRLCGSTLRSHSTWLRQPSREALFPAPFNPTSRVSKVKSPSLTGAVQRRGYKTVEEAKARSRMGPLTPIAICIFLGSGVGMYYYFQYERDRMERLRVAEHSKGMGRPKVGGAFKLVDQDGKPFSSEQMKGKYSLVYFGFSHCPDICPEELDKMSEMLSLVEDALPSSSARNPDLLPIFITCDPARDTPAVLKTYLVEFDKRLIGLTGEWQAIKDVCRAYRVYFSTPSNVKPGMDYLVDHSIYFYLMDPEGDFVEAVGRQHSPEAAAELITGHMKDWKGPIVKGSTGSV